MTPRPCRLLRALVAFGVALLVGRCGERATAATADPWPRFTVPTFQTYDQDDGLATTAITAIAQDGRGFMWFGSQGGLARFDGYRFHTYEPSETDPTALPDGWITTLHASRAGALWIGTSAGGLARYDPAIDGFVTYRTGHDGLSDMHVTAIADDDADGLWVGTENGLDHFAFTTDRVVVARRVARDARSIPNNRILSLLRDRAGTLWVGTSDGLAKLLRGTARFTRVPLGGRGTTAVASLYQDAPGRIWIGTTARGAFVLDSRDARPRPVVDRTNAIPDLATEWISSITTGARGEIWLGTYAHGLVTVDGTTGALGRIVHSAATTSLPKGNVWASYRDRTGGVWLGTLGGIGRLETSDDAISSLGAIEGVDPTLSDGGVVSLARIGDGRVWAGLITKGIDVVDAAHHRVRNVPPSARRSDVALPSAAILAIQDVSGAGVYVGSLAGLYRADRSATHVARVLLPGREPAAVAHALARTGGRIWVGDSEDGLWSFVPNSTHLDTEHFDANVLTDRRVVSLFPGRAHDLWIGTRNGLNRLDLTTHAIERIRPDPHDPEMLDAGFVASMAFDRSGRLWVATSGGGVDVLVRRSGGRPVFRRLTRAMGLPDDGVDALRPDGRGRMWVSTDRGLAVVDETTFAIHTFGRADGAPTSPYFVNSSVTLPNGDLLFGNYGAGITIVRPDRVRIRGERPPIVVTDARVGGTVVASSRFNDADARVPLVLTPSTNSLQLEFSALDYSAPGSNRYAYRLDGFDRDWVYADASRRLAAYTNLPPGDRVLHLRGTDRHGTWSPTTTDVLVRVLPAWNQTWWFRLLLSIAIVACVVAVVQARTSYLRRRQIELERLVAERTAELEESHRRIELIALSDPLTGLPNRRQFNDDVRVLTAGADRHSRHVALLLIDLDHFKAINDTLGHDAGDALLVEVARRLRLALRLSDRIARLGGDEFAILLDDLPGTFASDRESVAFICTRVLESFEAPIALAGDVVRATPSIGVALAPEHAEKPASLYKAADLALYRSKREGRNTWRLHDPSDGATEDVVATHVSA